MGGQRVMKVYFRIIRYLPYKSLRGQPRFFIGATSHGIAHEGFHRYKLTFTQKISFLGRLK